MNPSEKGWLKKYLEFRKELIVLPAKSTTQELTPVLRILPKNILSPAVFQN